jgi:uncharacterized protein (TIGR02466 family)
MDVIDIFSTLLVSELYPDINNNILESYAINYRNEEPLGVNKSNIKGWQSDTLTRPNNEIGKLTISIEQTVAALHNQLGIKDNVELCLNNLWININTDSAFNAPHVHPDALLAGVYYVKVPEYSGDIVFKNPAINQQYHIPKASVKNFNKVLASKWTVTPKNNMCLIFPAWIEHYVEPNPTHEERISIAFNIGIR